MQVVFKRRYAKCPKARFDRGAFAAQGGAYTRLDFEARGGASPSFATSVLVRAVAFSVSYLRGGNALSASDLQTINGWVKKLMRNMSKKAHSPDHKASIAAAMMAWGAATGDAGLYRSGLSKVSSFLGGLRSKPYFSKKVRVNNEVLPIVLMAAHVARLNSTDLFARRYGKHNLHDAVAYHAAWVSRTGTARVQTEAISDKVARSIMKSTGWGTHKAWIPLYLAHFPRSHAAPEVRNLHARVKRAQNTAYHGRNMGVHSACYFGL